MTIDKSNIFDKLRNPIAMIGGLIMLLGVWYSISVTYNNVGVLDQRVDKKIEVQNKHREKIHKGEIKDAIHDTEIEKLKEEIEELREEIKSLR